MDRSYELMKNFIPKKTTRKCRKNGEFLIISDHFGAIYYLNDVASDVWKYIDNKRSIKEIVKEFLKEYDVEKECFESDIMKLIRDLQWKGVIRLKMGNI